jgi:hypothetical protein
MSLEALGWICSRCFYGADDAHEEQQFEQETLDLTSLSEEVKHHAIRLSKALNPSRQKGLARVLEILADAAELRVPRSDKEVDLALFVAACLPVLKVLRSLDSSIEQSLHEILSDGEFYGFENGSSINVTYIKQDGGLKEGQTSPDFMHRTLRVAIYCDGDAHHSQPNDRQRDNEIVDALASKGWRTIRLTGRAILYAPDKCAAIIRRAIDDQKKKISTE